MEIKILCQCGTKFKFDVEPIHGRMPAPVNCPACAADETAQANTIIQSTLAPAPPEPAAAPNPPAPAPGGLRINRPAAPVAPSPAEAEVGDDPSPMGAGPFHHRPVAREEKPTSPLVKALTTIVVVACVGFGVWKFGSKWYKRLDLVAKVATAVGEAGVDQGESEGAKNLWYDNCAILFIKHTNHLEVAEACKTFWKDKLHKKLTLIDASHEIENPGEYDLIAAHNGYVRILGEHDWPIPQHEALAQYLSQKFATLTFEWRSESFADTYHFGIYDQGARKFHAQMDIRMTQDDAKEIVTTEGNDYAIAHGFKPGQEGFKDFHVLHADKITQKLGMKLWDEKDGMELKAILLKETGPAM